MTSSDQTALRPEDDEPSYRSGEVLSPPALRRDLRARYGPNGGQLVVAVDGRSASGKSTAADALAAGDPAWAVVHTDDVAWWHSFFDWAELLVEGVLAPFRAGMPVRFRPPGWVERDRPGAIEVPATVEVLVVEGVGASRRELSPLIDVSVWVHTPWERVMTREVARAQAGESTRELQLDWMGAELPFLAADRPWSRAHLAVDGATSDRAEFTLLELAADRPPNQLGDGGSAGTAQRAR